METCFNNSVDQDFKPHSFLCVKVTNLFLECPHVKRPFAVSESKKDFLSTPIQPNHNSHAKREKKNLLKYKPQYIFKAEKNN